MIEAFIYPVPKGEEYEAPRMRDCHGATRLAMTEATLVGIRPYGFVGRLQALDGDAFGLASMDDALLVRGDAIGGFGDPRGDIGGDHDNPVLVAVQQAAGIDPHASHLHRDPKVDQVDVGVRHGYVRGAELKT